MSTTVFAAPVAASEQQATASLVKQLNHVRSMTANFEQSTKATQPGPSCDPEKRFDRTTYESNL